MIIIIKHHQLTLINYETDWTYKSNTSKSPTNHSNRFTQKDNYENNNINNSSSLYSSSPQLSTTESVQVMRDYTHDENLFPSGENENLNIGKSIRQRTN